MKTIKIIATTIMAVALVTAAVVIVAGTGQLPAAIAQGPNQSNAAMTYISSDLDSDDDTDDDFDDDNNDDDDRSNLRATTPTAPDRTIIENTTASAPTTTTNASSADKTFYVFNDEVEDDIEDTDAMLSQEDGFIPDDDSDIDIFSLQTIVVNKGDTVAIHFFNLDDDDDNNERHSFTIDAPYGIDADLAGDEDTVVTFTADSEGIYQYYSKYDLPQMTGQIVVMSEQQSAVNATN